ncbi:MAG: hypothetical protein K2H70_04930, partial [Bacteroidales bacterium]|nr:hypothetical protein [Bacteroidales bacterium]
MKKLGFWALAAGLLLALLVACGRTGDRQAGSVVSERTVRETIDSLAVQAPDMDKALIAKGVAQAAALWRAEDGTEADFSAFVREHFARTPEAKRALFDKMSEALEVFYGTSNQVAVRLQKAVHLSGPEPEAIDYMLGSFDPYAHLSEDLFANKIAFVNILNFPFYTLEEKNTLGTDWSRLEWAYARLGDAFTTRVPAEINSAYAQALAASENYIAAYNIMMGQLRTDDGRRLFPEDMVLLSHWNLRDEIKSNYADVPDAHEKQEMIYKVMERIVDQTIPKEVINNAAYTWEPYANRTYRDGEAVTLAPEETERYAHILNTFHVERRIDAFSPALPTGIARNFEKGMEVSAAEIEKLFVSLLASPEVKRVAALIKERLGRELRPYDIWYAGFKSRSAMPEDKLHEMT